MYDRYDSNKGRYVTYDYRPKGDRFSRGLSAMPRVYKRMQHMETGHSYVRRVRTDEAQCLTVSQLKRMLPEALQEGLEGRTLYIDDHKHDLLAFVQIRLEYPGFPLRFEVTEQHKGKRLWFLCVGCGRRAGKLYRVKSALFFFPVWGCQKCLGLSYPSQAEHKTLARDTEIFHGQIKAGFWEELRAHHRQRRRMMKLYAGADRLLRRHR
jgi:hypothetical protein